MLSSYYWHWPGLELVALNWDMASDPRLLDKYQVHVLVQCYRGHNPRVGALPTRKFKDVEVVEFGIGGWWHYGLDPENPSGVVDVLWKNLMCPVMAAWVMRQESQRAKTLIGVARY